MTLITGSNNNPLYWPKFALAFSLSAYSVIGSQKCLKYKKNDTSCKKMEHERGKVK